MAECGRGLLQWAVLRSVEVYFCICFPHDNYLVAHLPGYCCKFPLHFLFQGKLTAVE